MGADLEAPVGDPVDWGQLYRARGDEVGPHRPCFTGDVYDGAVEEEGGDGRVMVLQHPCAMRRNGLDLVPRLLVAHVRPHQLLRPSKWTGFTRVMPLPDLLPEESGPERHQAAFFNDLNLVAPAMLGRRIAVLSARGVNLLLQRWLHHNSRVVVPTGDFLRAVGGPFEEADLVEEWCEELPDVDPAESAAECLGWLRQTQPDGTMRQRMLEDEQNRSAIRREMRQYLRSRTSPPD